MKPSFEKYALVALTAAMALLVACSTDKGGQSRDCELQAKSSIVSFGTICLDSEAEGSFQLENIGSAECEVDLAIEGEAKAFFSLPQTHLVVPMGGIVPITARYYPTSAGGGLAGETHGATLIITTSSNTEEPLDLDVTLKGETAATEGKAILSLSCAAGVKSCSASGRDPTEPCCIVVDQPTNDMPPHYGRDYLTKIEFGSIEAGRTGTVPLEVTNFGCGELVLTSLTLDATAGQGFCDPSTVTVTTPLPVTVGGSVSAQDRKSATVNLQFVPGGSCTYTGEVVLATNDPDIVASDPNTGKYGRFRAVGSGRESAVGTDQSFIQFGDVATGTTLAKEFTLFNRGNLDAPIASVALRDASGPFQITKMQRKDCESGTLHDLHAPFTLGGIDSNPACGSDLAIITVSFTPLRADTFSNQVDIGYGAGLITVGLEGSSKPTLEVIPSNQIRFMGPSLLSCEPLTCSIGNLPNGSCAGACTRDDDCYGVPCIAGVCANDSNAACAETCGTADRVVRLCNNGHAPLKFDDASEGGGLVITGPGGSEAPVHYTGTVDPARDGKPIFSITQNECADTSGNGKTLSEGACCEATISFLDKRNGGMADAELHVYTNDPRYPRQAKGFVVELKSVTEVDKDPVAIWEAYDRDDGLGSVPKAGRMAVLDASGSYDFACEDCSPPTYNPIVSYQWELVAVGGAGDYVTAMVGPIDNSNPNARCPESINGGTCFQVMGNGKALHFYPDGAYPRSYTFKLTVGDGVCSPQHTNSAQQSFGAVQQ